MKYTSYYWIQNRIAVRLIGKIHEQVQDPYKEGIKVIDKDWDNLIILDAARRDLFEEVIDTEMFDTYTTVTSIGSTSGQWLSRNFSDRTFGDTINVTANPHTSIEVPEQFFKLIEVEREPIENSVWEEDIIDFHPETLADAARAAHYEHPNKRMIVHFMTPHMPFIATPEHIYGKYRDGVDGKLGITNTPRHIFEALANRKISKDTFWEAYKRELQYGFDYALELARDLGGKTVFTADHGNMVGERTWPIPIRLYGHPRGVRTPEIVEVPWAELTIGERREHVDETANSRSELDAEEIDDRLRSLGYKI